MCSVWCVFNFTHKLHRLGSTGSYTLPPKPKKRRLSFWKSSKGKSQYHQNTKGGKLLGCRRELNWVPNDWGKLRKSFYFFVVILSVFRLLLISSTNVGQVCCLQMSAFCTLYHNQQTYVEIMSLQRLQQFSATTVWSFFVVYVMFWKVWIAERDQFDSILHDINIMNLNLLKTTKFTSNCNPLPLK